MLKYFAAVFFITLYLLKGMVAVMPALMAGDKNHSLMAAFIDTEENEKRNNGEKPGSETKELYLHHNHLANFNVAGTLQKTAAVSVHQPGFIQQTERVIPTPPPELS